MRRCDVLLCLGLGGPGPNNPTTCVRTCLGWRVQHAGLGSFLSLSVRVLSPELLWERLLSLKREFVLSVPAGNASPGLQQGVAELLSQASPISLGPSLLLGRLLIEDPGKTESTTAALLSLVQQGCLSLASFKTCPSFHWHPASNISDLARLSRRHRRESLWSGRLRSPMLLASVVQIPDPSSPAMSPTTLAPGFA